MCREADDCEPTSNMSCCSRPAKTVIKDTTKGDLKAGCCSQPHAQNTGTDLPHRAVVKNRETSEGDFKVTCSDISSYVNLCMCLTLVMYIDL